MKNNLAQKALQIQQENINNRKQQETNPNQQISKTDSNNFFARFYLDFYCNNTDLSQAPFEKWLNKNEGLPKLDREWILKTDLSTSDNEFIKEYKELLDNNSQINLDEANGYNDNKIIKKFIPLYSTKFVDNFIDEHYKLVFGEAPVNHEYAVSELLSYYPNLQNNLIVLDVAYQYANRDKSTEFDNFIKNYQHTLAEQQKKVSVLNNTFEQPIDKNVAEITNKVNDDNLEIFQNVDKKEDLLKATIFTEYNLHLEENVLGKIEQNYTLENNGNIYHSQNNEGKTLQLIDINPKKESEESLAILKGYKLLQIKYENDETTYFHLVKQEESLIINYPTIENGKKIVEELIFKPLTEQNNPDLFKTAIFGGLNNANDNAEIQPDITNSTINKNTLNSEINFVTIDARNDSEEDLPTTDNDNYHDYINETRVYKTKVELEKTKVAKIDSNALINIAEQSGEKPQTQVQPTMFAKLCNLISSCFKR